MVDLIEAFVSKIENPILIFMSLVLVVGTFYFKELGSIINKKSSLRKEILKERLDQADKTNDELTKELKALKREILISRKKLSSCRSAIKDQNTKFSHRNNLLKRTNEEYKFKTQIFLGDFKNDLKNILNLVRIMSNATAEQRSGYCDDLIRHCTELIGDIDKALDDLSRK